jgi:hypothetical protein
MAHERRGMDADPTIVQRSQNAQRGYIDLERRYWGQFAHVCGANWLSIYFSLAGFSLSRPKWLAGSKLGQPAVLLLLLSAATKCCYYYYYCWWYCHCCYRH